jgi:hypothetical protein
MVIMMNKVSLLLFLSSTISAVLAGAPASECPTTEEGQVCGGHGTCEINGDHKVCQCDRGYGGDGCTITGCADPTCSNHGTCQDPAITPAVEGNIALCLCDDGWTGANCDTEAGDCNPACLENQGVCQSGTCKCNKEFAGPTCGDEACGKDQLCSNQGTCDQSGQQFKCVCAQGFSGRDCSKQSIDCLDPMCGGNGQCDNENGACICNKGFAGANCTQSSCPSGCNARKGHGICVDNTRCECNEGFAGEGCLYKDCPNKCGVSCDILFSLFIFWGTERERERERERE